MIASNVVSKEKYRKVQLESLEFIKNTLVNSFGPMGSNTKIIKNGALSQYTKDGHTILNNIDCYRPIEKSVKEDLTEITRHIVKKVGDGTTSAVVLSAILFKLLNELEKLFTPYELMDELKVSVEKIKELILENKKEFNPETAYNITYISTNGNHEISNYMKEIYTKYGNDVFVDVAVSTSENHMIKEYDGMTLESGFSDVAYINDIKKGICSIRNPRLYVFEDPIDSIEMVSLFDKIIAANIIQPANENKPMIPTVILAPKLSRDMSASIELLVSHMLKFNEGNNFKHKPPFLLITNIYDVDAFNDISRMCGCKSIRKYIDPQQQEADIAKGLAPTLETVTEFYGKADVIESDSNSTKFINPSLMYEKDGNTFVIDENGNYIPSKEFNVLISFLEAELDKAQREGGDIRHIGTLKRRINSLKCNLIEYHIGGITVADRDSLRALVEDAVLNCRSASKYGVGYGANIEGLIASAKLFSKEKSKINELLFDSYKQLSHILFGTTTKCNETIDSLFKVCFGKNEDGSDCLPINLKTKKRDKNVLSSIMTDIEVLNAVSQIISIMFTSNQFFTPTAVENVYDQN